MRIGIRTFFIKPPILYKESTLVNFGFLIKEDLICGFNFCLHRLKLPAPYPEYLAETEMLP